MLISKAEKLISLADKGNGGFGLFTATAVGALAGFTVGGPGGALVGGAAGLAGARATQLTGQYGKNERTKNTPFSATSMYFTPQQAEVGKKLFEARKKELNQTKEKNKLTAAELADKKKQAELDALKKKFDVDRINLETALANSKDEAEKARIRSLLTIMDDDANSAAKRLAELDKANMAKLNSEYLAAVSLNNLAEAAKYAAMGVKELTLGGVPISQYPAYKDNPVYQKAIEVEAQIALNESEAALAEAIASATRAGVSAQELGAITNITINTPIGSEEALTEAVQKAVQQLNRYGYSQTYAGAIPTP